MQKELKRRYGGVFERWKVDLALGRIQAMGFARSEWPDLMQELVVALLEFRYDPARANRASERTVLYEVISRRLRHQMRTRCRDTARWARYARQTGMKADGSGQEPCVLLSAPVDMDVAQVVQGLDEFHRAVCRGLAAGFSRAEMARQLGCDWHSVERAIGRIRRAFAAVGLGQGDLR